MLHIFAAINKMITYRNASCINLSACCPGGAATTDLYMAMIKNTVAIGTVASLLAFYKVLTVAYGVPHAAALGLVVKRVMAILISAFHTENAQLYNAFTTSAICSPFLQSKNSRPYQIEPGFRGLGQRCYKCT